MFPLQGLKLVFFNPFLPYALPSELSVVAARNVTAYPHSNLVVSISFLSNTMSNWIYNINLEKICWSSIRIIQSLFFNIQPPRCVHRRFRHAAKHLLLVLILSVRCSLLHLTELMMDTDQTYAQIS